MMQNTGMFEDADYNENSQSGVNGMGDGSNRYDSAIGMSGVGTK